MSSSEEGEGRSPQRPRGDGGRDRKAAATAKGRQGSLAATCSRGTGLGQVLPRSLQKEPTLPTAGFWAAGPVPSHLPASARWPLASPHRSGSWGGWLPAVCHLNTQAEALRARRKGISDSARRKHRPRPLPRGLGTLQDRCTCRRDCRPLGWPAPLSKAWVLSFVWKLPSTTFHPPGGAGEPWPGVSACRRTMNVCYSPLISSELANVSLHHKHLLETAPG